MLQTSQSEESIELVRETSAEMFVINLCASTTPVTLAHPATAELKRFTFFVTRRREEGRERFRLHMGYFASLAEAESMLAAVRDVYPAAWAGPAPESRAPARTPRPAMTVVPPPKAGTGRGRGRCAGPFPRPSLPHRYAAPTAREAGCSRACIDRVRSRARRHRARADRCAAGRRQARDRCGNACRNVARRGGGCRDCGTARRRGARGVDVDDGVVQGVGRARVDVERPRGPRGTGG